MSEEINESQGGGATKGGGLSFVKLSVFLVIVVAIVFAGYFLIKQGGIGQIVAVASVNGQKITRSEYNERFARFASTVTAQGQSATTTEMQSLIKKQALDDLVTETLLLQLAEKEGIKVDEKVVETAFAQSKSQFPDVSAYKKALTDQGFTESAFKSALRRNNIIQQYFKAHINSSSAVATEKEIKALYDQVASNDKTVPPLKEVRTQVENQIIQQKQQVLIGNFIQQLKASSTIEILLK